MANIRQENTQKTMTTADIKAEIKRLEKTGKDVDVIYYLKRKLNALA